MQRKRGLGLIGGDFGFGGRKVFLYYATDREFQLLCTFPLRFALCRVVRGGLCVFIYLFFSGHGNFP